MSKKYKNIREESYEANMELSRKGLVIYTFGNVSAFDKDAGVFAIKPSGLPYEELSPDNIVIVDLENNIVEGTLNPSSDTKTHSILYKNFPDLGGITHTHSKYASAWAQAKKDVPVYGTTHADHILSSIPCTDSLDEKSIERDYETETGLKIVSTFNDRNIISSEVNMVLVASHGPFTWGKDADKSVYNSVVLEYLCEMAYLTVSINPNISELNRALSHKHFYRKHGDSAYYGQK